MSGFNNAHVPVVIDRHQELNSGLGRFLFVLIQIAFRRPFNFPVPHGAKIPVSLADEQIFRTVITIIPVNMDHVFISIQHPPDMCRCYHSMFTNITFGADLSRSKNVLLSGDLTNKPTTFVLVMFFINVIRMFTFHRTTSLPALKLPPRFGVILFAAIQTFSGFSFFHTFPHTFL